MSGRIWVDGITVFATKAHASSAVHARLDDLLHFRWLSGSVKLGIVLIAAALVGALADVYMARRAERRRMEQDRRSVTR